MTPSLNPSSNKESFSRVLETPLCSSTSALRRKNPQSLSPTSPSTQSSTPSQTTWQAENEARAKSGLSYMPSTQKIEKGESRSTWEQNSWRKSRSWASAPLLLSSITVRSSSTRPAPATPSTTGRLCGSLSETRSWAMRKRTLSTWKWRSAVSTPEFRVRLRNLERRQLNRMC